MELHALSLQSLIFSVCNFQRMQSGGAPSPAHCPRLRSPSSSSWKQLFVLGPAGLAPLSVCPVIDIIIGHLLFQSFGLAQHLRVPGYSISSVRTTWHVLQLWFPWCAQHSGHLLSRTIDFWATEWQTMSWFPLIYWIALFGPGCQYIAISICTFNSTRSCSSHPTPRPPINPSWLSVVDCRLSVNQLDTCCSVLRLLRWKARQLAFADELPYVDKWASL